MKKNYLVLLTLVFGLLLLAGIGTIVHAPTPQQSSGASSQKTHTISLTIQGITEHDVLDIQSGETLLALLNDLNAHDKRIALKTKDYKGLGTLVQGLGELQNGTDGKYWQYKVNGVMPQVGADAYVLQDNDSIEWFFAASQE